MTNNFAFEVKVDLSLNYTFKGGGWEVMVGVGGSSQPAFGLWLGLSSAIIIALCTRSIIKDGG